ncbi:MAG TPA: ribulose-phosphate 3-epimerase [Feifaniaceae bacterium]|nr:ribulose-phosphate 3-epimerase [Feifaniaceae bacterium]
MSGNVWDRKIIYSPSLICLDLCNLERQVRELEEQGCPMLHVDILDGYFSPSMPIGLDVVRQLRKKTRMPFDVHLMSVQQDYFVEELLDIGVEQLIFHAECEPHIDNRLNMIRRAGVRAGVALKPATPLTVLEYVLEKCDTVLLMLINPGYAGSAQERQAPYAPRKIAELRTMIKSRGLPVKIEIDGRVSPGNIEEYGRGLADIFVTGSTCIGRDAIPAGMEALNALRARVLSEQEGTDDAKSQL